ncbi:DUF6308 family protein [Propionibacteriaceae bacterium Y1923]|uniref:DUF6308 family protein n=1 Tax=Aestuariimicrobium sp. Y1814 TaxID=3418742 RepID=UPI003C152116
MTVTLTASLEPDAQEQAVAVLQRYFHPGGKFAGSRWDTFDPSGTRAASANTFTADDLMACSLLSAPMKEKAVVALLLDRRREFEVLLQDIGPDRDFITVETTEGPEYAPVRALYGALTSIDGIGQTRATKLLARKRPRLVPIVDDVIWEKVFNFAPYQWQPLHEALRADDCALWNRLISLREDAGLSPAVPVLRIFDVLAWMDGKGYSGTPVGSDDQA